MTSENGEQNSVQQGRHASAPEPLTKREQKRARKAAQKAANEAAKQAKKAAKAAEKAAKKGGGVVAPVASATATTPAAKVEAAAAAAPRKISVVTGEPLDDAPMSEVAAKPLDEAPMSEVAAKLQHLPSTMPIDAPVEHVHMGAVEEAPSQGADYGYAPVAAAGAYEQYSRYNVEGAEPPAPKRKKKRGRVVAAILIVLACLTGAGFAGANIYLDRLNQNLAGEDVEEAKEVKEALTAVPIGDDPFYMLLVGCDDREGVDGARADTTILARIDPKKNRVTLLSIPRDTAIEIDGYGTQKFNAAYTYGGPSGTIDAAKQLCGVEISHYAEVHFEALIDIIDYIGGVDVDVPIAIDDVDAGGKVDAGMQHLDGEHAMIFARSRSYASGDYQRTTNQRLLIKAAIEKVLSMDPTTYPGLLTELSKSITTDFSIQELLGLAQAFTDEPELKMYSAIVPSYTTMIDDVSYVIADVDALAEMMKLIDKGKNPAKLEYEDPTVKSSKEAKKEGIETIINYGDENYGTGYEGEYYDPGYTEDYGYDEYYDDSGEYDESTEEYDEGYDESYEEEGETEEYYSEEY